MQVGDTIYLKSGGPAMTVDEINGKVITCKWFSGATAQRGDFPELGLVVDDPTPVIEATRQAAVDAANAAAKAAADVAIPAKV